MNRTFTALIVDCRCFFQHLSNKHPTSHQHLCLPAFSASDFSRGAGPVVVSIRKEDVAKALGAEPGGYGDAKRI